MVEYPFDTLNNIKNHIAYESVKNILYINNNFNSSDNNIYAFEMKIGGGGSSVLQSKIIKKEKNYQIISQMRLSPDRKSLFTLIDGCIFQNMNKKKFP